VGTKLKLAFEWGMHDSVGIDLVAMSVNDVLVQWAEPLFFLDYFACGKLDVDTAATVVQGIATGCEQAGCALMGGETAEMPGMYGDDFDLVGVINGIVEKDKIITGEKIKPGHIAIGLASNGLHTNGYSLARRVLFQQCGYTIDTELKELGETIGEALLKPHISYWPAVNMAMKKNLALDGIAHITGGGLYDNVPRILPKNVNVIFDSKVMPIPPIFSLIVEEGTIPREEAYRVFNMGIGMVWFVPEKSVAAALKICKAAGFDADVIGKVVKGKRNVIVE
jgi:phosphoribosylformylglycinamidine cyclo-ligase